MLLAHQTADAKVIAGLAKIVVVADFPFTASAIILQPITGALLIWLVGYSFADRATSLTLLWPRNAARTAIG